MNASELMTNLEQVMDTMGFDPKFKENPTYEEILSEIRNMILQINIADYDKVWVTSKEGHISFNYNSEFGDKYSFNLYCTGPGSVQFERVVDKKPYVGNNGHEVRTGERIQTIASLGNDGIVDIRTNLKSVDDYECDYYKEHNSHEMLRKAQYTSEGVMVLDERYYKSSKEPVSLDKSAKWVHPVIERIFDEKFLLRRDKIDTASMVIMKNERGSSSITFSAKVPLSGEHGYRNMVTQAGINENTESIEIPDKTEFEVQAMLDKETNPIVKEGLARFAVGRVGYYYNSEDDPHFVNQVAEQNISRSI